MRCHCCARLEVFQSYQTLLFFANVAAVLENLCCIVLELHTYEQFMLEVKLVIDTLDSQIIFNCLKMNFSLTK